MTTGKKWRPLMAVLGVVVITAGLVAWQQHDKPAAPTGTTTPHQGDQAASWPALAGGASAAANPDFEASQARLPGAKAANPLDSMVAPTFRATDNGELAIDQQTRVDVERIHALYPRDEAVAKVAELSQGLPDRARRELKNLLQQYAQYDQAVAQTYPPGLTVDTAEEAARQLEGLHGLRERYFGAAQAEALFGEEEKTSRELMALMQTQKDPNLSLQEKAEKAQEIWKKNHPPPPPQP